jgi:catechol 2,3-dioxygenase-like lactoylglutathione lyase family enzyme
MIIGLHHGGVTVIDLDRAIAHLSALSAWSIVHALDSSHPLVAGLGVTRAALIEGPNAFIEVLEVAGRAGSPRRAVAEPGITHLSVQLPDMAAKNAQVARLGIERHAEPVELGTGFSYLYVRDREHNVVEIEGAAHAPKELSPWFSHVGIATNNIDRLRSFYESLLVAPAVATVRFGESDALDQVTALEEAEVTMSWVPAANARVELLEFHHPETGRPERRPVGTPGVGHLAFEVDNLEAAVAGAADAGAEVIGRPGRDGEVDVARIADPDGNLIELVAFAEDHPLSLRNVESFTRYRDMDALLYGRSGA